MTNDYVFLIMCLTLNNTAFIFTVIGIYFFNINDEKSDWADQTGFFVLNSSQKHPAWSSGAEDDLNIKVSILSWALTWYEFDATVLSGTHQKFTCNVLACSASVWFSHIWSMIHLVLTWLTRNSLCSVLEHLSKSLYKPTLTTLP